VNQDALIGAIGNLLDNALDAIGVDEHVLCSIELVDERVLRISVKDQGIGLSGEQQQKIFEPFYSNKSNGTGLGLAVVQQVVNAHAGEINCVSNLGVGTVMVIRLPVLILPLKKQSNRSL
jgi:two-component system sensor histidine kinase FlrB